MAELKSTVYTMWVEGDRGNAETAEQLAERRRLTARWYDLRHQLRAA